MTQCWCCYPQIRISYWLNGRVLERMGHVTYLVNMFDKKKRRLFHVNKLKTFSVRTAPEVCCSYAEEDVDQDDISVWNEASTKKAECYQMVFSD